MMRDIGYIRIMKIPFNKSWLSGKETVYINELVRGEHFSGNGPFTRRCREVLSNQYGYGENYLTTSCTDALELSALLCDIGPGDEVILPSYTFVSTANAFALRGATLKFADSLPDHPNIDPASVKKLISKQTKAIVLMHYAGMACDMHALLRIAQEKNLFLIEDAAQCIGAYYEGQALGTLGDLGTLSFHETKNLHCGEGGALLINNKRLMKKAELAIEKGTNRMAFLRGETSSYEWQSLGSSFLPPETSAAFLLAQLENGTEALAHRKSLWNCYFNHLTSVSSPLWKLPKIETWMDHNAHHFFILCKDQSTRDRIRKHLAEKNIASSFHYIPLHTSSFISKQNAQHVSLPNAERFGETLLRLPLFNTLTEQEVDEVCKAVLGEQ